ncbi:hypothetical protein Agub_g1224, partial [Astrephomene gubernaculifera]
VTPSGVLLSCLDALAYAGPSAGSAAAAAAASTVAEGDLPPAHHHRHAAADPHQHPQPYPQQGAPRSTWPSPKSSRFEDRSISGDAAAAGAGAGTAAGQLADLTSTPPRSVGAATSMSISVSGGGGGGGGNAVSGGGGGDGASGSRSLPTARSGSVSTAAMAAAEEDGDAAAAGGGAVAKMRVDDVNDDGNEISGIGLGGAEEAAANALGIGAEWGAAAGADAGAEEVEEVELSPGAAVWWGSPAPDVTLGAVAPGCVALVRRNQRRIMILGVVSAAGQEYQPAGGSDGGG